MISVALKPKDINERLDTRLISYVSEFYLLENLTARLVSMNEDGSYQLELASKIDVITPQEYTIEIRESYFSNGDRITIQDVYESLARVLKFNSSHVVLKDVVKSINVKDGKLHVLLFKPTKSFFYYLSLPDLGVLHRTQYSKDEIFGRDFVNCSSGPFSYLKKGSDYLLVKNEHQRIHSSKYPSLIKLVDPFGKDTADLILTNQVDLGQISLESFFINEDRFLKDSKLTYLGVPSDALTYISFNKYNTNVWSHENRQWFKCKLEEQFKVPERLNRMARRSHQYFPPESKAYVDESEILESKKKCPQARPKNFPTSIKIHTYKTIFKVSIKELLKDLEKIEGLNIEIIPDVETSRAMDMMKSGAFDLFLNVMSTDFRVPVEAINFEYFSPESRFRDHKGLIKKLFDQYQDAGSDRNEEELLKQITRTMNEEIEFIPLFHAAIPYFFNNSKVSMDTPSHLFIMDFWKLKN